jgi:nucleoside-diphosphate-sugar epimerase
MKYIVTGGCGFIGSNAVDFLVNNGHEVAVIDDLSSDVHDTFYFNEKAKYYKYSVTDFIMCSDVFKRHKPDVILHFAAEARIQNCIEDPSKAFNVNTGGTITMLDLCKKYSVKKLILSSTSAIYGNKNLEQIESMQPDCLNPYSLSKFHAEQYCQMYGIMYGVQSVCLRYFNVYGPRNPTKGQYSPVIGVFQKQKSNGDKLTIVGDGQQTRDFVHVTDIVKANYIVSNSNKTFYGDVFNVGTSKNYSINGIAEAIQEDKSFHVHVPQRPMECRDTKANIEKIKHTFGWEPKIDLMNYLQNG